MWNEYEIKKTRICFLVRRTCQFSHCKPMEACEQNIQRTTGARVIIYLTDCVQLLTNVLVFNTLIVQSLYFLNPKCQASNQIGGCTVRFVSDLVGKKRRQVFLIRCTYFIFIVLRIVKLSSPNINNILLVGCILTYMTVVLKTTDSEIAAFCKVRRL